MTHDQLTLIVTMRERTALPSLQCKFYLRQANWDLDEAIRIAHNVRRNQFLLVNEWTR